MSEYVKINHAHTIILIYEIFVFQYIKDQIASIVFNMTWSALLYEIMCIHLSMSIEHDFMWSTTYCVLACICAQHCIMRARRLVPEDPTSFSFISIYELSTWWRLGGQWLITHSMCLQFFCLHDSDKSYMYYQIM